MTTPAHSPLPDKCSQGGAAVDTEHQPIEPLRRPDLSEYFGSFFPVAGERARSKAMTALCAQQEARSPVPVSVWGEDPRRQQLAEFICELAHKEAWASPHFIPDDHADVVLDYYGRDGLAVVQLVMDIEGELAIGIGEQEFEQLMGMTLGQAIDHLLARAPHWPVERYPSGTAATPEALGCASHAIFLDLRRYLQHHLEVEREQVRPDADLGELIPHQTRMTAGQYIERRYGVGFPARLRSLHVLPTGWTLLLVIVVAVGATVATGFAYWWITLVAAVVAVIVLLRTAKHEWRSDLRTLRDLVSWLVEHPRKATKLPRNAE